jgi:uncharacterized membrane protein YphA (DoxX/SURF4 family)
MRLSDSPSPALGLLPLRVVIALVFLMHGGQKLFVIGIAGTTGLLLVCDMAVAILAVKLHGGFFAPAGFEFELTLLAGALTLALLAPGRRVAAP